MKLKLKTNPVTTPVQRVEETPIPRKLEPYIGNQSGNMAGGDMDRCPIDVLDHKCQRPLHPQRLIKWASQSKEVDWNLFGYVTVVRLADGSLRRINGKHRMQLVKWLLPEVTEVPAHIIDCTDDKYAARLFTEMNGTHSGKLTGEEMLWAGIIAGLDWAMYTKNFLDLAELSCGMVNEDQYDYRVKRDIFEKSLRYTEEGTIHAVKLIKTAYPSINRIDGQVMCGLARLFSIKKGGELVYDDLTNTNTKLGKMFWDWFMFQPESGSKIKEFHYDELKGNGSWENASAFGIYRKFLASCENKGMRSKCPHIGAVQTVHTNNIGQQINEEEE